MFSIGIGYEQAYLSLFNELSIVHSLSSRNLQNSHPHCFVSNTKSKAKKIEIHPNTVKNSQAKLLCKRSGTCSETLSFALGIFNELSCLLLSPLETCLNLFLSRRNKTNESVDIPKTTQSTKLILYYSLRSFWSVASLTCHKTFFSFLGEINIMHSDWFLAGACADICP